MPPPDERAALRLVARAFVAVLVLLVAIPSYLTLAPGWRPLAGRLACALLVAFGGVRIVRSVRGAMAGHAPSALDAPSPRAQAPDLDERFLRLRDELRFSVRSRQYFDTILWPQLCRLSHADLPRPAERRRGPGRDGPSLSTLERIVAAIEGRA
ncbi:MAG TPA: hypothetical protein VK548_19445 [Candidatus Acidoferrum sp.]|nr:hypothetical protein [Candidatus Acidoferrum sp.]